MDTGKTYIPCQQTNKGISLIRQAFEDLFEEGAPGDLDMNGFKIINIADATTPQGVPSYQQLQTAIAAVTSISATDNSCTVACLDGGSVSMSGTNVLLGGMPIKNMADGVDPQDAVTFAQLALKRDKIDTISDISVNTPNLANGNAMDMNHNFINNVNPGILSDDATNLSQVEALIAADFKDRITTVTNDNEVIVSDGDNSTHFTINSNPNELVISDNGGQPRFTAQGYDFQMTGGTNDFTINGDASTSQTSFSLIASDTPATSQLGIMQFGTSTTTALFGAGHYDLGMGQVPVTFIQGNLNSSIGEGTTVYASGQALANNTLQMDQDLYPFIIQPQSRFNRKTGYDPTSSITITENTQFPDKQYVDNAVATISGRSLAQISIANPNAGNVLMNNFKIIGLQAGGLTAGAAVNTTELQTYLATKRDVVDSLATISTTAPTLSNIDSNTHKVINLQDASSAQDATAYHQLTDAISGLSGVYRDINKPFDRIVDNNTLPFQSVIAYSANQPTIGTGQGSIIANQTAYPSFNNATAFLANNLEFQYGFDQTLGINAPSGGQTLCSRNYNDDRYMRSDQSLDDIANSNPTGGNVNINSHKLTNVTAGSISTDAVNFGQLSGFVANPLTSALNFNGFKGINVATPTLAQDIANKTYVDTNTLPTTSTLNSIATAHPTTADISMNSHKLTSVTDPTLAQDAATKNYVDTHFTDRIQTTTINNQVLTNDTGNKVDFKINNVPSVLQISTDGAGSTVYTNKLAMRAFASGLGSSDNFLQNASTNTTVSNFEYIQADLGSGDGSASLVARLNNTAGRANFCQLQCGIQSATTGGDTSNQTVMVSSDSANAKTTISAGNFTDTNMTLYNTSQANALPIQVNAKAGYNGAITIDQTHQFIDLNFYQTATEYLVLRTTTTLSTNTNYVNQWATVYSSISSKIAFNVATGHVSLLSGVPYRIGLGCSVQSAALQDAQYQLSVVNSTGNTLIRPFGTTGQNSSSASSFYTQDNGANPNGGWGQTSFIYVPSGNIDVQLRCTFAGGVQSIDYLLWEISSVY